MVVSLLKWRMRPRYQIWSQGQYWIVWDRVNAVEKYKTSNGRVVEELVLRLNRIEHFQQQKVQSPDLIRFNRVLVTHAGFRETSVCYG